MKFINLILENVKIPFEAKCILTIVNSEGIKYKLIVKYQQQKKKK